MTNPTHDPFAPLIGNGSPGRFAQGDDDLSRRTGAPQQYDIHYTRWLPTAPGDRVIVYTHGLQSHRGWFYPTATELADRGFVVYAYDRIGSGTSGDGMALHRGKIVRGRGHIRSWRLFLDTLEAMVALARRENPDRGIVLWGNSYGTKILTAYLYDRGQQLADTGIVSAVFSSPGNYVDSRTMPLPFSRLSVLLGGALRKFPVPMVERDGDNGASWFVAPGPWFDRIKADALSLREVSGAFYLQTRKLERYGNRRPSGQKMGLPCFYLMVRDDRLMDNTRMERDLTAHASDSYYKYYGGGPQRKHFLFFTEDRAQAIEDVLLFLDSRGEWIDGARHATHRS